MNCRITRRAVNLILGALVVWLGWRLLRAEHRLAELEGRGTGCRIQYGPVR